MPPVKNFSKTFFNEETTKKETQHILRVRTTQALQTENCKVFTGTQTDNREDQTEMQDWYVSRINYKIASQEERAPNEEPPTMTNTQLEASHHMITVGIVATVIQMTETGKDTPLFRKLLQKVLGIKFIAAATRKDRNLRPLINFVNKRG